MENTSFFIDDCFYLADKRMVPRISLIKYIALKQCDSQALDNISLFFNLTPAQIQDSVTLLRSVTTQSRTKEFYAAFEGGFYRLLYPPIFATPPVADDYKSANACPRRQVIESIGVHQNPPSSEEEVEHVLKRSTATTFLYKYDISNPTTISSTQTPFPDQKPILVVRFGANYQLTNTDGLDSGNRGALWEEVIEIYNLVSGLVLSPHTFTLFEDYHYIIQMLTSNIIFTSKKLTLPIECDYKLVATLPIVKIQLNQVKTEVPLSCVSNILEALFSQFSSRIRYTSCAFHSPQALQYIHIAVKTQIQYKIIRFGYFSPEECRKFNQVMYYIITGKIDVFRDDPALMATLSGKTEPAIHNQKYKPSSRQKDRSLKNRDIKSDFAAGHLSVSSNTVARHFRQDRLANLHVGDYNYYMRVIRENKYMAPCFDSRLSFILNDTIPQPICLRLPQSNTFSRSPRLLIKQIDGYDVLVCDIGTKAAIFSSQNYQFYKTTLLTPNVAFRLLDNDKWAMATQDKFVVNYRPKNFNTILTQLRRWYPNSLILVFVWELGRILLDCVTTKTINDLGHLQTLIQSLEENSPPPLLGYTTILPIWFQTLDIYPETANIRVLSKLVYTPTPKLSSPLLQTLLSVITSHPNDNSTSQVAGSLTSNVTLDETSTVLYVYNKFRSVFGGHTLLCTTHPTPLQSTDCLVIKLSNEALYLNTTLSDMPHFLFFSGKTSSTKTATHLLIISNSVLNMCKSGDTPNSFLKLLSHIQQNFLLHGGNLLSYTNLSIVFVWPWEFALLKFQLYSRFVLKTTAPLDFVSMYTWFILLRQSNVWTNSFSPLVLDFLNTLSHHNVVHMREWCSYASLTLTKNVITHPIATIAQYMMIMTITLIQMPLQNINLNSLYTDSGLGRRLVDFLITQFLNKKGHRQSRLPIFSKPICPMVVTETTTPNSTDMYEIYMRTPLCFSQKITSILNRQHYNNILLDDGSKNNAIAKQPLDETNTNDSDNSSDNIKSDNPTPLNQEYLTLLKWYQSTHNQKHVKTEAPTSKIVNDNGLSDTNPDDEYDHYNLYPDLTHDDEDIMSCDSDDSSASTYSFKNHGMRVDGIDGHIETTSSQQSLDTPSTTGQPRRQPTTTVDDTTQSTPNLEKLLRCRGWSKGQVRSGKRKIDTLLESGQKRQKKNFIDESERGSEFSNVIKRGKKVVENYYNGQTQAYVFQNKNETISCNCIPFPNFVIKQ
jgi:hypothetical protein